MKNTIAVSLLALSILPIMSWAQDLTKSLPDSPSSRSAAKGFVDISEIDSQAGDPQAADPPSTSAPTTT